MMTRIAWRSLLTRPVRAAVLAAGFGFGIAVMIVLLGVGHVMLEQSRAPALRGGGDVVVTAPFGVVQSARYVMSSLLGASEMSGRIVAMSPSRSARLYVMAAEGPIAINARGGIPSMERAIGDPEVSSIGAWTDRAADARWSRPEPGDVLRAMDRFHPIPEAADSSSWAEWLYFNGRTADGRTRIYLTFLVGPAAKTAGKRVAGVRLQLHRDGRSENFTAREEIDERSLLANAPDLEIANNRVRLEGLQYRLLLDLRGSRSDEVLRGELTLDAAPGRSLPPATIRGAHGWVSGYVVPVLSGTLRGAFTIAQERTAFEGTGYHDHNWGFWRGVSWQWGQVAGPEVSIVYGRVFPPAEVADSTRVRGFLIVTGADGPLGFSTDVEIDDRDPGRIGVTARGRSLELRLTLDVHETVRTAQPLARMPEDRPLDFLQLGGLFHVVGRVGERALDFTARGAAETFKPQ
jgi:hypothetical protein